MSMYKQKYILLLSVAQSQPTHTLATHNQATRFSSKSCMWYADIVIAVSLQPIYWAGMYRCPLIMSRQ
jgi:hypothetical protein